MSAYFYVILPVFANLILGVAIGWWYARRQTTGIQSIVPDTGPAPSIMIGRIREGMRLYHSEIDTFAGFIRSPQEGEGSIPPSWVISAQRNANAWLCSLLSGWQQRIDHNRGATSRELTVLDNEVERFRSRVERFDARLGRYAADGDRDDQVCVVAMMVELLEENQTLGDRLVEAERLLAERERQLRTAEERACTDPLTGLGNRASFDERLEQLHALFERGGKGFALTLIDVDHFKSVNDSHGHIAGDQILTSLARILRAETRKYDHVVRYGGDEFAILSADTDVRGAAALVVRLRNHVAREHFECGDECLPVTMSIGIAAVRVGDNVDELIRRADAALYDAKENGRDCVSLDRDDRQDVSEELDLAAGWQPECALQSRAHAAQPGV